MSKKCEIGVYYFPNYHVDPRNEKWHGREWTEWELVKNAKPRFEGHYQPRVPAWGYEDESRPEVMVKKIKAASEHGIDAFIFDWYWYNDGPYLNRALEQGFLKAENRKDLKFALMWANHDWTDIHPCTRHLDPSVLAQGVITPETFEKMTDYIIENFFTQENYWRLDGDLYMSFYMPSNLVQGFGSVEKTREALDRFRKKTADRGLGRLHLNSVVWCRQILPGEILVEDINGFLKALGFDSVSSYVWVHHYLPDDRLTVPYDEMIRHSVPLFSKYTDEYNVPYFPNITMGWDPSPRTIMTDRYEVLDYPYTAIVTENTPEKFKAALEEMKRFTEENHTKMFTINAWNEWTEGSYLEPDDLNGYGYLEAVACVFGKKKMEA